MSEQNPNSNAEIVQTQSEGQGESSKEEFVQRKAYEDVSRDMHKYKDRNKEFQAKLAEAETKLKMIEEDKLVQQEKFKELYENERKQRMEREKTFEQKEKGYYDSLKKTALRSELGNINATYLIHADLSAIELLDDGTLSSESVHEVANRFRQDHPMLVPQDGGGNITNAAPPTNRTVVQTKDKTLDSMSFQEKVEYLKSLKN